MSSLLQMFAPSNERTKADYFGTQQHTEDRRKGLDFCCSAAITIYLTTSPETSTSPPLILVWERLVWPDTNFWCWPSAISPSSLKLFQSSKAYGKSGAAKATPNAPLLTPLWQKGGSRRWTCDKCWNDRWETHCGSAANYFICHGYHFPYNLYGELTPRWVWPWWYDSIVQICHYLVVA